MRRRWIAAAAVALLAGGVAGWWLGHHARPVTYTYHGTVYSCSTVMHEPFFTLAADGSIRPTVPLEVVKYCSEH